MWKDVMRKRVGDGGRVIQLIKKGKAREGYARFKVYLYNAATGILFTCIYL